MKDINGKELKTGQIVEIKNAYFKNDNGVYFVEHSPSDPKETWTGTDYCLKKVCKNGKLSRSSRNICFWPISVFVNDPLVREEANEWNDDNATIEVLDNVNPSFVKEFFVWKSEQQAESASKFRMLYGEEHKFTVNALVASNHFASVAAGI